MAAKPGGGGGNTPSSTPGTDFISDRALIAFGIVIGFLVIPRLAYSAPVAVNSILLVILLGALLINEERWLPWLRRLANAAARR